MSVEDGTLEVNGVAYSLVTIDVETFFDKTYTLSGKMNTSEYIRDDRFHAHGVGIKIGNGKTLWYTGKNIPLALREIDWSKSAMLAHNTAFDGFICSHVYGIRPAVYLDTLSMARAAHGHHMRHDLDTIAKAHGLAGKVKRDALADTKGKQQLTDKEERALGAYCVDDVEDTYKIFWKLFDYIPDNELQLIDMTQKMFCDPVLEIDIPRVKAELENELGAKAAALLRSGAQVDDLMSNDKFARLLQAAGAQLPQKISPSTGKLTYAFAKSDLAFQDLMKTGNDKVRALCEARLKVKSTIGETRAVRFLEAGRDGMKLPVLLNYSGAHTHRWSGGNRMNLQSLKRGGELRRSILAPKGHVIVVADSAQIEARVLAWLAGQTDIVDAFARKEDVYKLMASAIYGVPVDQVTKDQRFIGKICIAEGTLVLSDSGWKPIEQVTIDDRLWDGEEWVCHQGLLNNGMRKTLSVCGAWMTPDHQILSATRWLDAQSVVRDENTLSQALDIGAANLPYEATYAVREEGLPPSLSNAIARILSMQSTAITSGLSEAHAAQYAAEKPLQQNVTGPIAKLCRVMNTALDYLTASPPPLRDVTQKRLSISSTMVGAELLSAVNGVTIELPSSSTFRQFLGGMTQRWKWTALTTTRGITPATYASSPSPQTSETNVESLISKRVFDILNSGSRNRFTILTDAGPLIVHNCVLGLGYSMGHMKLQQTLKQGTMGPSVDISLEECRRIVNIYRSRNYKIKNLWKIMDGIIASMLTGTHGEYGPLTYGKGYIQLPSGLFLQYYGLHGEAEVRHDDLVVNEATYLTRQGRSKIYGGLLTENCLAGDSLVLTNSGWKRLDCVGVGDLVHDGVEFVQHGGVLTKSVQNCVSIDGVYMTPDHEVLTDEGWKIASQNPEPYRPDLRQLGGHLASIQQWKKAFLGVQMRVRKGEEHLGGRLEKGEHTQLRMQNEGVTVGSPLDTRHVQTPRFCSMAQHVGALPKTVSPSLEELWWARDPSNARLAEVRKLLARHEGRVPTRAESRQDRQQPRVLKNELPLGEPPCASHEPARSVAVQHPTTKRSDGDTQIDVVLPTEARPVFDIVNAGPRQRFVVLGNNGPFIVHNCVQALARCIIADQMLAVNRAGHRLCTMSHDELVCVVPKTRADSALREIIEIMSTPPEWADGLPLAAEGGWSINYSK